MERDRARVVVENVQGSADPMTKLTDSDAQLAVDLTRPDAVMANVEYCIANRIHCVVGTSGVDDDQLDAIRLLLDSANGANGADGIGVIVVPNFAIGAVLAIRFARQAAIYFDGVEVIEMHHAGKVDAPSGTAGSTAREIARARAEAGLPKMQDATSRAVYGARGADIDGVKVHSVRLPGLVAHQQVLLGNDGELLTIRHDSLHRGSFMPGLLLAIRAVSTRPGLTLGLEPLLDLG
ncbi:MAG: 4-hydroxy-tetrahydrodipicolinate reductase [Actinomycetota bacterium]|nr:4-hydroxy-tetrahydrodipicolinate reductase [Actinomycetota bacterium]